MSAVFGEIIRRARSQRGWDQAELARHLTGVGQQTVSRWERGSSRPRRATVGQLAQLLDLDVGDLLVAAGFVAATADRPDEVQAPVRPRLTTLPLDKLPPDVFEQFTADLVGALYPEATVHRYGGQGHSQGGIDVVVNHLTGKPTGIQCKREKRFGPANVSKAVDELTVDVRECFIYLTRVASPGARQEISKYENWQLWDVEDISRAVRLLSDRDAALRIVDTYFPGWREPFLGVRAPGPWLTAEEFFRSFSGDRIYSHGWQLVGRAHELGELTRFIAAPDKTIGVLVGRGGIGKTRLLRALAAEAGSGKLGDVRFLATSVAVEQAQFEILPPDDGLVVVIDDAHDRVDNGAVIAGIRRARPKAKILLSLRPHGLGHLAADLRQAGLHLSELPSWTLDDLAFAEAEALAGEVLGADASPAVAQRLAGVAPDCPLLVVVGATLIKRGQLSPGLLETSDSIRTEILTRFRDAVVADSAVGDPELRREALRAVAVLQPFRIDDPRFRATISNLTGKPFDQVLPHLRGLEGAGVLLRRGASLRVVPDLLGDVILADAAIDGPSGTSTGYLERVYQAAAGEALQHVFINTSRVDWQTRRDRASRTLIEPLWTQAVAEFQAAGIAGRLEMLKLLEKVSFFQPDRTLALVRWAIENPTGLVEEIDHPLANLYSPTYKDVLEELPALLANVAYNLDYLPTVVDVLWDLARHDTRPTNQYPGHPIRVLSEIAEYGSSKPVIFQETLVDAVQRWLERHDIADWPYSPFEVVKPILAPEAEDRRSDGLSVTLRSFPVNVQAVKGLRGRVLDLAFTEARSEDPRRAVEAVKTIEASLTYPPGLFNRQVSAEERERWTPLFVETIDRVGQLLAEEDLDPAVSVAASRALRWHAQHSPTETRPAAQAALARIRTSVDRHLAQVLYDGWGHFLERTGDVQEFERLRQAHLEEVAAAVTRQWSEEEVVNILAERLTSNRRAYGENSGQPGPFVWTLVRHNPTIGDLICRRVAENPTGILRELVPVVLGRLTDENSSTALARARELLATQDLVVQRYVAQAFGWGRSNRQELAEGEADLLRSLIKHEDPLVRQMTVAAARALSKDRHPLAVELVTTVRFDDSAEIAEEVAGVFGPGYLSWGDLSDTQARALFEQLRLCPRIDGYQVVTLLGEVSKRQPEAVLKLLAGRVEAYEQDRSLSQFEPLPHTWHNRLQFREGEHFVELLRSVVSWMAEGAESWLRQREGAEIFAVIAEHFDEQVLQILAEAIATGRKEQIRAVGAILHKAPRTLVWENVDFVAGVLRAAEKHGEDCVQAVGGGFHAAVTTGVRWGTPGQPFREDIEQRDKSIEVATRLPTGSIEQRFYQSLQASAESRIRWEEDHDRTFIDGRAW